jgi:ABC-type multidrug transport system ATPase subunit
MCTSVGIMHKGRLLQHGSIASVLESMQAEAAIVRIELLDAIERAMSWLEDHDRVDGIAIEGTRISFRFEGGKDEQSKLLSTLVREEFRVVSFSPQDSGIESLLMSLIEEETDS